MRVFGDLALVLAVCTTLSGCVYSGRLDSPDSAEPELYKVSAVGRDRKVSLKAIKKAKEYCVSDGRRYLFVKHRYDRKSSLGVEWFSYELYFSCIDEGAPRSAAPASKAGPVILAPKKAVSPPPAAPTPVPPKETASPVVTPPSQPAPAAPVAVPAPSSGLPPAGTQPPAAEPGKAPAPVPAEREPLETLPSGVVTSTPAAPPEPEAPVVTPPPAETRPPVEAPPPAVPPVKAKEEAQAPVAPAGAPASPEVAAPRDIPP
ncbi:MAG: hypothetical protein AB1456_01920, partial [Thermodesulfobacteriota bacterium]